MQFAFFFDQTRCMGCCTCVVACKDWHDVPPGPVSWRKVTIVEEGKYPNPSVAFLTTSCLHCAEPSCIQACPSGALLKRKEDGIITVDRNTCLGKDCGLCKAACPYDAPQFGDGTSEKMQMCDFCFDRWMEGKKPICVEACPTRAMDAGPIQELQSRYGDNKKAKGFSYDPALDPSVIFKSK